MKKLSTGLLFGVLAVSSCAQNSNKTKASVAVTTEPVQKSLLWKISGNGLEKPSYLFGTIHMLCEEDALLSPNMKKAIKGADEIYLELDLDNMVEMLGALAKLKMTGDTTLQDLLSDQDYKKVKDYFETKQSMIPFSMLETFKPILAASTLQEGDLPCDNTSAMEEIIMQEAKANEKKISGLETMSYQAGMLDSIPYRLQAQQLVMYIDSAGKSEASEVKEMLSAYKEQDLVKLEAIINKSDAGISRFTEILLYNRNRNWVKKLKELLPGKSLVVAVGAGHLPGDQGVINLLKKEGYKVEPIDNKIVKPSKDI
jgi:uncharacterized protein YbaP (TraB family)